MFSKNILLTLLSILFMLAAAEVLLRIADYPRQLMKPEKIKDPILVYRIPSDWPGTDADGFRNRDIPAQVDIVTLGDSHTYGLNADMDTNWPGQLAKLTGMKVYNYGIGGYSPLQYFHLFDRALKLKPKTIVVGLYLPNDIAGLCHPYQRTNYWKQNQPLFPGSPTFCERSSFSEEEAGGKKTSASMRKLLYPVVNSKIGVLISITARRMRAYLPRDEKHNVVISDERNQTIMNKSRIRALSDSMDLQQPVIAHSLDITKKLLKQMHATGKANATDVRVLVIPSKEFVFYQYLPEKQGNLPQSYHQLAENETRLREDVLGWLATAGIPHVDAAPALLEAVRSTGKIYPHDNDGHPLPAGYAVYARSVHDTFFKPHPRQE